MFERDSVLADKVVIGKLTFAERGCADWCCKAIGFGANWTTGNIASYCTDYSSESLTDGQTRVDLLPLRLPLPLLIAPIKFIWWCCGSFCWPTEAAILQHSNFWLARWIALKVSRLWELPRLLQTPRIRQDILSCQQVENMVWFDIKLNVVKAN